MIFFSLTLLPTPWSERIQDKLPSWNSEHFHTPIPAYKNSDTRAELETGKGKETILETSPGTCHSWSHQSLHSFSSHSQCHLLLSITLPTQIHHIIECSHHCMPPRILLFPLTLHVLYGSSCGGTQTESICFMLEFKDVWLCSDTALWALTSPMTRPPNPRSLASNFLVRITVELWSGFPKGSIPGILLYFLPWLATGFPGWFYFLHHVSQLRSNWSALYNYGLGLQQASFAFFYT